MSQPSYHTYPGYATGLSEDFGYSQSVRVGERIEASGQGMCGRLSIPVNVRRPG